MTKVTASFKIDKKLKEAAEQVLREKAAKEKTKKTFSAMVEGLIKSFVNKSSKKATV